MSGKPDPDYDLYKFKVPGTQYLIALSIDNSDIVFFAGSYLPGQCNNLDILRDCGILDELEP